MAGSKVSSLAKTHDPLSTPALTSSTWPCPLPYPATFSGTVRGKRVWQHKQVNLIVALLSWLHLSSPSECPDGLGLGAALSTSQHRAVRAIEFFVEDRTTSFKFDAELMGRASVKAEDQDKILGALSQAASAFEGAPSYFRTNVPCSVPEQRCVPDDFCGKLDFGKVVGTLPLPAFCPAKPIQAERLKFSSAPSFSPVGYLDEPTLQRFLRPLDFATPPAQALEPPPKVRILADREQRIALFSALAQSGRLLPVTVHPERIPYAGGLFAVVKDMQRDRLILDSRPGNTLEFWTGSLGRCPEDFYR